MHATELLPDRYLLTPERLAAVLDLGRIRIGPRATFSDLPAIQDPAAVLRGTKLISPQGTLTAEAESTMRVAADPRSVLTVLTLFAGDQNLRYINFLQGAQENPVVIQRSHEQGWDLTLLPTVAQGIVMVDDLLSLTRLPSQVGREPVELDLLGYAALLAAADGIQTAYLSARSNRSKSPSLILTTRILNEQLEKGLSSLDTRWAVSAGRLTSPVELGVARGQMAKGAERLRAVGFAQPAEKGLALTREGLELAGALGHILNASGIVLLEAMGERQATVTTLNLFRTMASIWLAMWTRVGEKDATVRLMEVSAAGALRLISTMFESEASRVAG